MQPAHEKIGVVDEQWIIHVGVPSLGNQVRLSAYCRCGILDLHEIAKYKNHPRWLSLFFLKFTY